MLLFQFNIFSQDCVLLRLDLHHSQSSRHLRIRFPLVEHLAFHVIVNPMWPLEESQFGLHALTKSHLRIRLKRM